jgi:hypothetical protein
VSAHSLQSLKSFFETAPVARMATRPLSREVEVALLLEGNLAARFTMETGEPRVLAEPARDPDFTLVLPDAAVARLIATGTEDVGEVGVEFFKLAISMDPANKIRIRLDAPTIRILGRGYLGVLAIGGMKVTGWLLKNGARNPKAAIDRIRSVGQR